MQKWRILEDESFHCFTLVGSCCLSCSWDLSSRIFQVVRDTATGGAGSVEPIDIPPPRPKRKPVHPYPRKLGHSAPNGLAASAPRERSPSPAPSPSGQENRSPTSVLSAAGASGSTRRDPRASPDSPASGSMNPPSWGPVDRCGSSVLSSGEENGSQVGNSPMVSILLSSHVPCESPWISN